MADAIYLDNNATTPIDPAVVEAMHDCWLGLVGNPASQHEAGRRARRMLEAARKSIAEAVGAKTTGMEADRVVFTSGGTESNNLAVRGLAAREGRPPGQIIVSAIEHPSVALLAEQMERTGWDVERLPVDSRGQVRAEQLSPLMTPETRVVSVMLGNNETGVLQPVGELAAVCLGAGVPFHSDAVQCVGKVPVDFVSLGLSAMSMSAHKFHGPVGIGAVVLRGVTTMEPLLSGGFQQAGLRPGTEPVVLAVGMAKAIELSRADADAREQHLRGLRDRFEQQVIDSVPDAVVIGSEARRLPHTSNIAFRGYDRQALAMALDVAGVACSTGSACASGSSEPSPVLIAMGCDEVAIRGSLRFSFGAFTSAADIDEAARRIINCCNKLRRDR